MTQFRSRVSGVFDLPAEQREVLAKFRMGTGETYDFTWLPSVPVDASILVYSDFATNVGHFLLSQPLQVH